MQEIKLCHDRKMKMEMPISNSNQVEQCNSLQLKQHSGAKTQGGFGKQCKNTLPLSGKANFKYGEDN